MSRIIKKFKIDESTRSKIYIELNKLADTAIENNIFEKHARNIINTFILDIITTTPITNYIDESFLNYEDLTAEDNFFFQDEHFIIEYNNLIDIIKHFKKFLYDYKKILIA